jgi:hypothetical protein
MSCAKKEYATKAKAKRSLLRQQPNFRRPKAVRVYRCPECGWWHLTSERRFNGGGRK